MAPQTWPLLMDSSLCHETQVDRDLGACPLPQTSPDLVPAPPRPQAEVAPWPCYPAPRAGESSSSDSQLLHTNHVPPPAPRTLTATPETESGSPTPLYRGSAV